MNLIKIESLNKPNTELVILDAITWRKMCEREQYEKMNRIALNKYFIERGIVTK